MAVGNARLSTTGSLVDCNVPKNTSPKDPVAIGVCQLAWIDSLFSCSITATGSARCRFGLRRSFGVRWRGGRKDEEKKGAGGFVIVCAVECANAGSLSSQLIVLSACPAMTFNSLSMEFMQSLLPGDELIRIPLSCLPRERESATPTSALPCKQCYEKAVSWLKIVDASGTGWLVAAIQRKWRDPKTAKILFSGGFASRSIQSKPTLPDFDLMKFCEFSIINIQLISVAEISIPLGSIPWSRLYCYPSPWEEGYHCSP